MSNRVGFRGYGKPETIAADALENALKRMNLENLYIYWTGAGYRFRSGSLRSAALSVISTPKAPIPVSEWIRKAARCVSEEDSIGYKPDSVKAGLYLHRGSKPAVYFALERDLAGNFVLATDVPNPDETNYPRSKFPKGLKKGDIIIPAPSALLALEAGKADAEKAPSSEAIALLRSATEGSGTEAAPEVEAPPAQALEAPKGSAEGGKAPTERAVRRRRGK